MNFQTQRDAKPTTLTKQDFARVRKIAKSLFGLHLEDSKHQLVQSRLSKRLRVLGLNSYSDYCDFLQTHSEVETRKFISALTTNVTGFYREPHHFQFIEQSLAPAFRAKAKRGEEIRFWSAGCSTGQEAYSLAATLQHCMRGIRNPKISVLATDVDDEALAAAAKAEYSSYGTHSCPSHYLDRLFGKLNGTSHKAEIRPEIRSLVRFENLNLLKLKKYKVSFDVIMCRNVSIYFDKEMQNSLWSSLYKNLEHSGVLFIGHSERIPNAETLHLDNVGITSYMKKCNN